MCVPVKVFFLMKKAICIEENSPNIKGKPMVKLKLGTVIGRKIPKG
jgi:hypothetical protein